MKHAILLLLLWCCCVPIKAGNVNEGLERIRMNFAKAATEKAVCKMMMEELSGADQTPLYRAYLGAFKAMWAKYTFNPFAKLNTFNTGRKYIENAVQQDPENVEIRLIRLSVQKNCPSFLGYNRQIESDRQFIIANKNQIGSVQLQKMLTGILQG